MVFNAIPSYQDISTSYTSDGKERYLTAPSLDLLNPKSLRKVIG